MYAHVKASCLVIHKQYFLLKCGSLEIICVKRGYSNSYFSPSLLRRGCVYFGAKFPLFLLFSVFFPKKCASFWPLFLNLPPFSKDIVPHHFFYRLAGMQIGNLLIIGASPTLIVTTRNLLYLGSLEI